MTESSTLRFLVRKRTTFTWLVPVGLLIATCFWGRWNTAEVVAGFLLLVLGEIVRFWAAGYIQKDDVIATTGPYALVRNPLYFGSLLLAVGYLLISGLGVVAWLVVLALFLLFHMAAITYEESFLKEKFGEPYHAYLQQTSRLIPMPRFSRPAAAAQQDQEAGRFSMQQAIYNREHTTAIVTFVTAVIFTIVLMIKQGHLTR